jgi:Tfp pilus assembly protein PilN
MKFKLNLIRELQAQQELKRSTRTKVAWLMVLSYGLLIIVLAYGIGEVFTMRAKVGEERSRLLLVKTEYQHYKASEMIVNKADVELLSRLQNSRIYWTKKLLVMARYLPENYWITQFGYDQNALTVNGYGYISERQEQLMTLHDYLDALRKDSNFNDVFRPIFLNSTVRNDDERKRDRISFSYTGIGRRER